MKIAFDFWGVLSHHEWAREIARCLLTAGHQVYCISAASLEWKMNGMQEAMIRETKIPFTGIEVVAGDQLLAGDAAHIEAGRLKAEVMKRLGILVLIDDIPPVITEVRRHGLIGLHLQ